MLRITTLTAAVLLCVAPLDARAESGAQRKDRVTYNRLVRQLRVISSKFHDLQQRALNQAHRNGGEVPDALKAEILSLQDEQERKTTRLQLITLRHGWEMPNLAGGSASAEAVDGPSTRAAVFGPVDRMVRRELAREASVIAGQVYLPVISDPTAKKN